jgi:MOSC domain-containing protein YiiM
LTSSANSFPDIVVAHIVSLVYTPADIEQRPADRYARVPLDRAMLLEGHGIAGDMKGRSDSRQLNVMLAEMVESLRAEGFHSAPGELGEQIVIAGLDPDTLLAGVRLRLGESAILELVFPRQPCRRFAHIQGHPKDAARDRIGFMARVVRGGEVAIGTAVALEQLTGNSQS